MAKYFCPTELTRPGVPEHQRFFFIEVEAAGSMEALVKHREAAIAMMGGSAGYARWAPVKDECPTFEYMQALRRGLDKSKGRSPKARMRAVDAELERIAA